ncbi:hypothetical protein [Hyphomicrobium sp. ghe19]|uniref:hypothetical protein n=1 Tax=Hyphomicrobium sp. ghe19 TaxID=2682968 RepID=UPI001366E915|nr:hypothetical protein HYPP_03754 [Hyphomicrobium sp. ghe19]
MTGTISRAISSVREEAGSLASQVRIVSSAAPSLTASLLVVTFAVGVALGCWCSGPLHRRANNAEWVAKIAAQNPSVRGLIAKGDAEGEAVDNEVIRAIGESYAKLKAAETRLADQWKNPLSDRCSVPADCLRE